jgi:hypothetical protein
MPSPFKSRLAVFSILFLVSMLLPASARGDEDSIARLTNFSGTVLVKNLGEWGVTPVKNLSLYSQDKVVTREGTATITFADGAVVDIKNNSNLLINERETEKGLLKKVKVVNRRILLFMGKMFFKTGTGQIQTQFETEKSVIGIRGTEGILSIGSDGQIYITFTEGSAKFTLGDLVHGKIAKDVPTEVADQNPIQKASYIAYAAYEKCLEAKRKAVKGEISAVQELWFCAKAKELAAREVKIWATALAENNPYTEVVEWANEMISDSDEQIENSLESQKNAEEQGAVPEPQEEYQPPEQVSEPEGEAEAAEAYEPPEDEAEDLSDPPIQELQQAYEEEIPPVQDEGPASPPGPG